MSNKRTNALSQFMNHKVVIDSALERLQKLSDNHFDANSDEINWGHVGELSHYADLLKQITDMAFKEGEHAKIGAIS